MLEPLRENGDRKKVSLDKRCCNFLAICVVVLPVVVGVVVWYLTNSACDGGTRAVVGDAKPTDTAPTTVVIPTTIDPTEPWRNLRLPDYVIPIHYYITLYPNFYENNGWFYGNETVEMNITQSTKYILIHANYLNITRTELKYATGEKIIIKRTFWYEENQFWVVEATEPVRISLAHLVLQFNGSLTREIFGFYKSTYVNSITHEERYVRTEVSTIITYFYYY